MARAIVCIWKTAIRRGIRCQPTATARVTNGVRRKHARSHDGPGVNDRLLRDFEGRQAADDCKSLCTSVGSPAEASSMTTWETKFLKSVRRFVPIPAWPLVRGDNQVRDWDEATR